MADFWYLGSGQKEDWFDIASEQIIKDAEVELSKRDIFFIYNNRFLVVL
jgi:hypothetical protein